MGSFQTMLFSAQGRIRRSQYWLWGFISLLITWGLDIVINIVTNAQQAMMTTGHFPVPALIGYGIVGIFSIYTGVCVVAKRWHDRDKSAWMYLILLIPIVGFVWTLIECGCLDGTQGPNKFGPSPKGIGAAPNVF